MSREENVLEELDYNGFKIRIIQDPNPENPHDANGDSPVYLCHFHRQFHVCPDELPFSSQADCEEFLFGKDYAEDRKEWAIFLVEAHIHGGVSLSLQGNVPSHGWDISHCGAILVKKDGGWGVPEGETEPNYEKIAETHLEEWNMYLDGDVCGYVIEDSSGEELDSCWGYYGGKFCLDEAKRSADHLAKCTQNHSAYVLYQNGTWSKLNVPVPISVGVEKVSTWIWENRAVNRDKVEGVFYAKEGE